MEEKSWSLRELKEGGGEGSGGGGRPYIDQETPLDAGGADVP
jgi:hypothetical protein